LIHANDAMQTFSSCGEKIIGERRRIFITGPEEEEKLDTRVEWVVQCVSAKLVDSLEFVMPLED
jgi:hypothetical protein